MSKADPNFAGLADYECAETVRSSSQEAEKELAAFYGAVLELYGPRHAEQAADDWIIQLASSNESTPWRSISMAAADRLSARMLAERHFEPRPGRRLLRGRVDQMLHSMCPCTAK